MTALFLVIAYVIATASIVGFVRFDSDKWEIDRADATLAAVFWPIAIVVLLVIGAVGPTVTCARAAGRAVAFVFRGLAWPGRMLARCVARRAIPRARVVTK